MATYMRTGRISWSPLTDTQRGMLAQVAQYNVGEEFTATLDTDTEAFLIGEGVISAVVAVAGGLPAATGHRQAPMWNGSAWLADGVPRVVRCPFAYDTPGIAGNMSGAELYAPLVDDLLLDLWVEIVEPWDGNAPVGDVLLNGDLWTGFVGQPLDLTKADNGGSLLAGTQLSSFRDLSLLSSISANQGNGQPLSVSGSSLVFNDSGVVGGYRGVPARFNGATVRVRVGSHSLAATDPGSTHGRGFVYVMVATPATG